MRILLIIVIFSSLPPVAVILLVLLLFILLLNIYVTYLITSDKSDQHLLTTHPFLNV